MEWRFLRVQLSASSINPPTREHCACQSHDNTSVDINAFSFRVGSFTTPGHGLWYSWTANPEQSGLYVPSKTCNSCSHAQRQRKESLSTPLFAFRSHSRFEENFWDLACLGPSTKSAQILRSSQCKNATLESIIAYRAWWYSGCAWSCPISSNFKLRFRFLRLYSLILELCWFG